MGDRPFGGKSLRLYGALQMLVLAFCWGWFAILWTLSFTGSGFADPGAWFLLASGAAGLFGLRPNLEKAIDSLWLKEYKSQPKVMAQKASQLVPIKKRIDLIFSLVLMVLLIGAFIFFNLPAGTGTQG